MQESIVPCSCAHALVERTLIWVHALIKVGCGSLDEEGDSRPKKWGEGGEDKGPEAPSSRGL